MLRLPRPFASRTPPVVLQLLPRWYSMTRGDRGAFNQEELDRLGTRVKKFRGQLHLPSLGPDVRKPPSKRTLAVCVGWASSKLRVMKKFAPIYTTLGIPCVCVAPSIVHIWGTNLGSKLIVNVLKSLDSSLDEPTSLILHLFSSAPCLLFPNIIDGVSSSSALWKKMPPAGIIFDSGPSEYSYESGMAAAQLVYKQGGYNYVTYLIATSAGTVSEKFVGARKRSELRQVLDSTALNVPQLYLHSEVDTVSPPSRVSAVMDKQRAEGREVSSFCWRDSEHVRHYLTHPKEYTDQVAAFLRKCNIVD